MRDRTNLEEHLEAALRPGAVRARDSRGRKVPEDEPPYRGRYQRDRDRIIHSAPFRRLEYKTQVFVSVMEGDHYRNRLTHTLEVTQIARTAARALALNEDLVEALALAHDMGHGPFGHSGENALDEVMAGHGGFNHNIQGLRIVDELEIRYPDFPGLNLCYETREGFSKNLDGAQRARHGFAAGEAPPLEVQLVDHADSIAYDTHDIEDALVSGVMDEATARSMALWKETEDEVRAEHAVFATDHRLRWRATVRRMIRRLVSDLIAETERRLKAQGIDSLAKVRASDAELVGFSPELEKKKTVFEDFLEQNFYYNPKVRQHTALWQGRLKELFAAFRADPSRLPENHHARIKAGVPLERAICDYVAGMTDRFAERQWNDFCS